MVNKEVLPKANAPWNSFLGIQRLNLSAEEMGDEAEAAGVLVEGGDQVVRDHVAVRVYILWNWEFSKKCPATLSHINLNLIVYGII